MKKMSTISRILAFTAVILFVLFGCRNSLLNVIEDEVEEAVTPPNVLSVYPLDAATDIPITLSTITVTFSKKIDESSVTSQTFFISDPDGAVVNGQRQVDNDTITFTPVSSLIVGTVYTVTIDGISDEDGNKISEKYTWSFTTGIAGDTVVPVVNSVTVNDGDEWTNDQTVTVTVDASDNFGVAQMNVSLTGSFADAGWTTYSDTFQIDTGAGDGTKTVYMKVKDGSGNVSTAIGQGAIGLDTTSPTITAFILEGGNTGTRESSVRLEILAEDEETGSGIADYRVRSVESEEWDEEDWIALTDGSAFISDFALSVDADETETINLQVRDSAGNESVIDSRSITLDFTPPEVESSLCNPVPNSGDNKTSSYVKIAFDGEMDTSTFTHENIYISKGTVTISTGSFSIVDGKTAIEFTEFDLPDSDNKLEQNTSYTVFIGSEIADVAGNTFTGDYSYSFTNGSFLDETAPVGQVVLDLDEPGINATPDISFDLEIKAEDDYNGVRAVKIWGDNDGSQALFESDASWEIYGEGPSTPEGIDYMSYNSVIGVDWPLPGGDDDYFIYYKFIDYANNESQIPGILKVSLDTTAPVINNIFTDGGTGYSSNVNDTVNIIFDVTEDGSGLNEMWYSVVAEDTANAPVTKPVDDPAWEDWSSIVTDFELDSGEGQYYIYGEVKDYVDWKSGTASGFADYTSIILDYTPPEIGFDVTDFIEDNEIVLQTSTIEDNHPLGTGGYYVASGLDSFSWEQVDGEGTGPGIVQFYSDAEGTNKDNTQEEPYLSVGSSAAVPVVTDGSVDGTYFLKVTATDNAGNSADSIVEFVWDTTDPADIDTVTCYVDVVIDEGTGETEAVEFTNSGNSEMVYVAYAQPYGVWDIPDGADYFIGIPYNEDGIDPNDIPAEDYGHEDWYQHWDDDEVDWENPATYEDRNYIRSNEPRIGPPAPENPGDTDGPVYFYVSAWDKAGNRSNRTVNASAKFWIDTLPPVIVNIDEQPPQRDEFFIDYRNNNDDGEGRVYDQKTAFDPTPDTDGSGIETYSWTKSDGPGVITIEDAGILAPTITSCSIDGQYELKLTVTDKAGNTATGYVSFEWDTTAPNAPDLSSLDHTPNLSPTWSWTSGGNYGNGTYRYRIDRIARYNWNDPDEATGGEYNGSGEVVVGWTTTTDLFHNHGVLSDGYEYTLYVEERDEAGNWSASSSQSVWIDTEWTSAPSITRDGGYLRNGDSGDREVTWNWTTGTGTTGLQRYRVQLKDQYDDVVPGFAWSDLVDNDVDYFLDFSPVGEDLPDGIYTLEVEEYNMSDPEDPILVGKIGTSSVQIDATAPNHPEFYSKPGTIYAQQDDLTCYLTNDTTPYFYWHSGGGGGSGDYRWKFDTDDWTETRTYYMSPTVGAGVHTFYVQERDTAGNWSDSLEHFFEIDVTGPTPNSIILRNTATNPYNNYSYTTSTKLNIELSGTGNNEQTFDTTSDIRYMRFWNKKADGSNGTKYTYNYSTSLASWYLSNGGGTTADGYRYVYYELIDYAGNVSSNYIYDYINLDMNAPSITNLSINNGAEVASSSSIYLYSDLGSGAYKMRVSKDNGSTWSAWYNDADPLYLYNYLDPEDDRGAKNLIVQLTDAAGWYCRDMTAGTNYDKATQYTTDDDAIFYGKPVIKNAYKGWTSNGYIRAYYENFPVDPGLPSNKYEIWYSESPDGGNEVFLGETYSTGDYPYYQHYGMETGKPFYLYLKVENSAIGHTDFSDNDALCYSSNITIIYDDNDTVDTSVATKTKQWIQRDWATTNSSSYSFRLGSYIDYSVTLVPEDKIPTTYFYEDFEGTSALDGYNSTLMFGDPVIITPSASYTYSSAYDYVRAQNIAMAGHGIIGMHYSGWRFFQTVVNEGSGWGLSETLPTGIDYAYHKDPDTDTRYAGTVETSISYIWHYYLKHDDTYDNHRTDTDYEVLMFTTDPSQAYGLADRWSIRNYNASGTDGLYYWADDPEYEDYYTAAKQGRFAYWAYDKIPGYINAGIPFFYNVIRYMTIY